MPLPYESTTSGERAVQDMQKVLRAFGKKSSSIPIAGCQIWLGALSGNGYGRAYDPRKMRTVFAHRLAWEVSTDG